MSRWKGRGARPSKAPGAGTLTHGWRLWLLLPALWLAVLAAYQPAWHGGVLWDDDGHMTSGELRSAEGFRRIWLDLGATQQYYPVVHSAFWLFHRLWGDDTLGYHLVNIVLHGLSAFLVAVILRRLAVPGAVLAAVIFALHPVHVESVAWITELKNTLSGVFYLGAALAYFGFDRSRRWNRYALALALFVLAVLSKSVTATLPAALLIVFWWERGRLSWRQDVVPLLPFFVLGAAAGLVTAWVERTLIGAQGADFQLTMIERGLIAGRAIWFYLAKLVWPANLIFIYPRWQISQAVWWQYVYPISIIALFALLWQLSARGPREAFSRSRAPLAAMLLFTVTLFPALGFVNVFPFRFSFVADHFQYLASIPAIALITAGLSALAARWRGAPAPVGMAAVLVLGSLLGWLTWHQSRQYVNAETLYRTTIARNPACWMAYNNLGALKLEGSPDQAAEAAADIRESLRIYPNNAEAHNNLGVALLRMGRLDDAIGEHREALRLSANYAEAYNNLGVVLERLGRLDEAMEHYGKALRLKPINAEAHHNLASALQKLGRIDEARAHATEALTINPDYADARDSLGTILLRLGRLEEAIAQYRMAIRLRPDFAEAHNNLGIALAKAGRLEEAVAEFNETLRLRPDAVRTHINLGDALTRLGRREEAVLRFQHAMRVQPDLALAYYSLGNVFQDMGRIEDAVAQYREALRHEPASSAIHNDLGVALAELGRLREAVAHFNRALELRPDFAEARANLRKALAGLNRR